MLSRNRPTLPPSGFVSSSKGMEERSLVFPGIAPVHRTPTHYNTAHTMESENSTKMQLRGDLNGNNGPSNYRERPPSSQVSQAHNTALADFAMGNERSGEDITTLKEVSENDASANGPLPHSTIMWLSFEDEACAGLRFLADAAEHERLKVRPVTPTGQSPTSRRELIKADRSLNIIQARTPSGSKSPENEPLKGARTPELKSIKGALPSPPSSGKGYCHCTKENTSKNSTEPARVVAQTTAEENNLAVSPSVLAAPQITFKHATTLSAKIDEDDRLVARILYTMIETEKIKQTIENQNAGLHRPLPGGPSHSMSLRSKGGRSAGDDVQDATDIDHLKNHVNTLSIFHIPAKDHDAALVAINDKESDSATDVDERWASPPPSKKKNNGSGK
jgi:hypothetical protein